MIQQVSTAKYNRGQMEQKTLDDFSIDSDTDDDDHKSERIEPTPRAFVGQTTMSLLERFDKHKLAYLIANKEKYSPSLLKRLGDKVGADHDPFKKPEQYLHESRDGLASVSYHKAARTDWVVGLLTARFPCKISRERFDTRLPGVSTRIWIL